jgi:hypothetical protein
MNPQRPPTRRDRSATGVFTGKLVQGTDGRWFAYPPKHCPAGHRLQPRRMVVGFQVCGGDHTGGHTTWTCECGATVYAPELGSACRVLHGAAGNRSINPADSC